jgi:hypothetical protein
MTYTMRGPDLYDKHNRRIALTRGAGIYDNDNRRIGTIRGNDLFDSDNRKMMAVRGAYIYDNSDQRVASLVDVENVIVGAEMGMLSVALWYCFIR